MDQQKQSPWRLTKRQVLWILGIVVALTVGVLIGHRYGITLWDWIKVLIVPVAIAIGVAWLYRAQLPNLQISTDLSIDGALKALAPPKADAPKSLRGQLPGPVGAGDPTPARLVPMHLGTRDPVDRVGASGKRLLGDRRQCRGEDQQPENLARLPKAKCERLDEGTNSDGGA